MAHVVVSTGLHGKRLRISGLSTHSCHPRPRVGKGHIASRHHRKRPHKPRDATQMAHPCNTKKDDGQYTLRHHPDNPCWHYPRHSGVCHTLCHACPIATGTRFTPCLGRRLHGATPKQNAHHSPHRQSAILRLGHLCKHSGNTALHPCIDGPYQHTDSHGMVCHHHHSDNANSDILRPKNEERLAYESDCDPGKSYSPDTNLSSDCQGNCPNPCPSHPRGRLR